MMRLRSLTAGVLVIVLAAGAAAQVVAPPSPAKVHVDIRYRIEADRDGRVRLFRAMMAELHALGFVADSREDADLDIIDPNADRLAGVIESKNLDRLLNVVAVQSVLVRPESWTVPDDLKRPVQVSLKLASGLDPLTQRQLHEQAIAQLEKSGFVNAWGYDDRGFTRVRGEIPAAEVMNLLKDLRGRPAGWLLPSTTRAQLPMPLRSVLPVRLIEVLPDLEPIPAAPAATSASPKYGMDLRFALADPAFTAKPMRVEAALTAPIDDLKAYRFHLKTALPGVSLEGVVGTLVTFQAATVKDIEALAALPDVLALRLPPRAVNTVLSAAADGDTLSLTHLPDLHARGYRGKGRTIVVLGGSFDRNTSGMPKDAALVDLTMELSPSLETAAVNPAFNATAAAIAAHRAAPDANIILVRIDPAAFHQLETVARAVLGDFTLSNAQVARAEVLLAAFDDLSRRRDFVTQEYAEAFSNLSDDEKPRTRREQAQAALAKLKAAETTFRESYDKFTTLRKGLESLRGATAVVNTFVWDDGYPADGLSEFARFLDTRFSPMNRRNAVAAQPTWTQAASESTWSVWAGPALDRDGNSVLEFADAKTPLPAGSFTREINFLGLLNGDAASADLPAGTKLRITLQWREPHDPQGVQAGETLFDFQLQLLRQYDPTGKTTASDEFALVAVSNAAPVRLLRTASAGVYEQTLEVTLPAAGRYALRVGIAQAAADRFAVASRLAEVNPKITLRNLGDGGRPIFASFANARGGVGIPGDAAAAFTVGRCDAKGRSLSLLGAGPGLQLRAKPEALVTGAGSGASAATVAGLAAALADLGARPANLVGTTAIQSNGMLSLPVEWIQSLPKR